MKHHLTIALAGALAALAATAALAAPGPNPLPAGPVAGGEEGVLRCAGGAQVSALARDFGDGVRLPLSTIGISAGIIVVVTGRNINIVRRDCTEMRLKGLLPGEAPAGNDDPRPLIRNGEVWVQAQQLPQFLGRPCTCGATATNVAQTTSGTISRFDTFEVASPTILKPAPAPKPIWRPRELPSSPAEEAQGTSWLQVTPVETSLALSRIGGLAGPGLSGSFQEVWGPSWSARRDRNRNLDPESPVSRVLSYLTMGAEDNRRRYQAGDSYHPLYGWATGIGFTTPVSAVAEAGASVVVPAGLPGQGQEGQLMFQARVHPRDDLALETAMTRDGSYHALVRVSKPDLSLVSSVLALPDRERRDTWWRQRLWSGLAFVGRVSSATGEYAGNAQALGLRWDGGPWHVTAERDRSVFEGEGNTSSSFSALWIRPKLFAAVQYIAKDRAAGGSELEWTITRTEPSGKQLSLSVRTPQQGGNSYQLGASLPLSSALRAKASLDWGPGGSRPDLKLEWKRSREHMVVLRYGPSYADEDDAEPEPTLALYASLAFGRTGGGPLGACRIIGSVKNDAGEGVPDVVVLLDETTQALTAGDGGFAFNEVEEGVHQVQLDANRLHADLGADCRPRTLVATPAAPVQADFLVTRLCEIAGQALVIPISPEGVPGAPQPLAGAEAECNGSDALAKQGVRVTTDEQGRYRFTGLKAGRYVVSLAPGQDFRGLTPMPPSEWSFALHAGDKVSGANFVFQQRERPVVFIELTTPSQ